MTTDKKRLLGAVLILLVAGAALALRSPAQDPAGTAEQWLAVKPDALVHQIGLVGKIEPDTTLVLTAPFDGNVQANLVEQGQRVEAGQVLLRMDPATLQMQLRDALAAQLKARRTVQEMQDWDSSPAVSRARRSLRTAEMSAGNTQRKLTESDNLFKRGIIPRNELDDLKQQAQQQQLDLASARSELQQALDQGKGEYRQIADMELTNATVKYEALRTLLEGQDVKAPFSGIVVPAPGNNSAQGGNINNAPIQAGSKVSQGQVLFGLANIERLKIVAKVSELDINQLHQGQAVEVMGDGFDGERLSGSVSVVSGLAMASDSQGSAQFPVTLTIPRLTPQQLQRVRLGMSARLTIVTYNNAQALVVPSQAIQTDMTVEYREAMDKPVERVNVTTGQSTAQGVEVFGLKPGLVKILK
ncbi:MULTISPECIES: efflux RND transporter periplasmic adaptor subunit [Pseudomonas]|jgi:HlyD family secretion protein|uniref:HlyD family efflux transporter periplasmic adaptor subunit n=2 Tax=Pseudomonas TaxID=286 RepID=A0A4Y9TD61_PSEFL|nr:MULTISPECIES: HlyD family efflux transporter periplasmic adaptor subunit [Pseudomonas]MCX9153865.1 efflux RND transporter periplasmic adaptor subunit [Pseudomonas sp. TB1-B1]QXH65500.1 efflux RND transporter periplasmic adaptor subunit [Pseudomonas asgharzadehiana]TFW41300.1 HlyD family efflux transporter periplasmic adaptor subunit [Pseudomonas fluorescens]TKJ65446.1 HlyD family secretion protein [Pseudomonas sp. CFBP13506]CRM27598.1 putative efflux pump membrane fusion protein [Pseudomona